MYLKIKGTPNFFPKKEIKKAAHFYASLLFSKRMSSSVNVFLWFSKKQTADQGLDGTTEWLEDTNNPRDYLIVLDPKLRFDDMLKILGHEMTHVKQHVYNELKDIMRADNLMKWKGKIYKCQPGFFGVDPQKEKEYNNQPWEKEATKLSNVLYKSYMKGRNS